jgi:hypothetical protein
MGGEIDGLSSWMLSFLEVCVYVCMCVCTMSSIRINRNIRNCCTPSVCPL